MWMSEMSGMKKNEYEWKRMNVNKWMNMNEENECEWEGWMDEWMNEENEWV